MAEDVQAEIKRLKEKLKARKGRVGFERNVAAIEARIAELEGRE